MTRPSSLVSIQTIRRCRKEKIGPDFPWVEYDEETHDDDLL